MFRTLKRTIMAWEDYYLETVGTPPSQEIYDFVRSSMSKGGRALDLGAGMLSEAIEILLHGYDVDAVDSSEAFGAIAPLFDMPPTESGNRLKLWHASFEAFAYPVEYYDLVHSRLALSFCRKRMFNSVFQRMTRSLKPGGYFLGDLYGMIKGDAYLEDLHPTISLLYRDEIESIFTPFTIIEWEERNRPDDPNRVANNWHVHKILARKK